LSFLRLFPPRQPMPPRRIKNDAQYYDLTGKDAFLKISLLAIEKQT
jgi:hypothetical protein